MAWLFVYKKNEPWSRLLTITKMISKQIINKCKIWNCKAFRIKHGRKVKKKKWHIIKCVSVDKKKTKRRWHAAAEYLKKSTSWWNMKRRRMTLSKKKHILVREVPTRFPVESIVALFLQTWSLIICTKMVLLLDFCLCLKNKGSESAYMGWVSKPCHFQYVWSWISLADTLSPFSHQKVNSTHL